MTTIASSDALADSQPSVGLASRVVAAVKSEVAVARLALGAVALHVVDDSFLQPNPGTSATDQPAVSSRSGCWSPRSGSTRDSAPALARRSRFSAAISASSAASKRSTTRSEVGPSGDDYSGLLSLPAGLVLIGLGVATLWRSRKRAAGSGGVTRDAC